MTHELIAVLERIAVTLEGLRADMRRQQSSAVAPNVRADLVDAISDDLGQAAFTSEGLLQLAADYPHGELAAALRRLVDVDGAHAAVALGRLLARLPQVEVAGDRRGCRLFRLRGLPRDP